MFSEKYANKPVQFISMNSFGKIVLHAEAVAIIRALAPPISFASIVGPSKTGKSFLMSQIISQSQPFNESHTLGLWVWSKPILAYNQQGKITSILLIDSQGFQMQQKNKERTLISLILLLSNCLLYNSIGPIDSISFNELQQVMSIAREMKDKNGEFHWILRDFDPSLVNKLGINITASQYMENQLMDAENDYSSKTIQTLKQHFTNRSCHCFVKPTPSSIQQPPQFLKQIIELRRCLNGVASFNLDGNSLIIIIQSYVQSLNVGDSIGKACQEGNDCRIRLQCLSKLGDQLRDLQQKHSTNQIQDIQEHLSQLRINLKQYYKQRMCSHRQIQTLDEELNQIIQDFQQINDTTPQKTQPSRQIIRLKVPKHQKMVRLSLNVSDSQKERQQFESKPMISINKFNTSKSLQGKLEEFQTKIYRYELEASCSKIELQGLKQDYDKSKKELQSKTDFIESLIESTNNKEKEYLNKISRLSQEISQLRKQKIMVESQLSKITILNNQKIVFLQEQIDEITELKQRQIQLKEQKYKGRLNDCIKQIQEIKKSHEEELAQLKKIYKDNQQQLIESKQNKHNQTFYKEMREQMELLQNMKEEVQREKFAKNQLAQANKLLKKQIEAKEEMYKQSMQQQTKRNKQSQRRIEQMNLAKLQSKNRIIEQLQGKISELQWVKEKDEENMSSIVQENKQLLSELQQKEHRMTKIYSSSEHSNRQLAKLKDYLRQCEQAIQAITQDLKKKDQQISRLNSQNDRLKNSLKNVQATLSQKQKTLQDVKFQYLQLKAQFSVCQQTRQIEVADLKQKYEGQIGQLKQIIEAERQRFQSKSKQILSLADMNRRLKQQYQELQQQSAESQFQLRELLQQKQGLLQSKTLYVQELTLQCEHLSNKNCSYLSEIGKLKQEVLMIQKEASEAQQKDKQQMQDHSQKLWQSIHQKDKIIMALRQQLQKQAKINVVKMNQIKKQGQDLQRKMTEEHIQFTRHLQKKKEQISEQKKTVMQLTQQVAILNHKISLQQSNLSLKSQSKSLQITKLTERIRQLQSKNLQISNLTSNYSQQLRNLQVQGRQNKKMINAFIKQKQIALGNFVQLQNRYKIKERKYQSHLNLFQQKLQDKKNQNAQLKTLLEQYKQDYKNLNEAKGNLQRTLQKQMLISKNKLQLLSLHLKKQ